MSRRTLFALVPAAGLLVVLVLVGLNAFLATVAACVLFLAVRFGLAVLVEARS
jgi:hypothetical protein